MHRVIRFGQKGFVKKIWWYEHRFKKMKSKMNSKKTFSSEWIIQFRKKYGKYKKTQIYQTFKTERKRSYFVLEPNYHTRKCFSETLLAIEMIKTKLFTNKKNLSILDTSKMAMLVWLHKTNNYATWIWAAL